ncbi:MAG: hypothetical protein WAV38_05640, partial [Xanthobacteraceae bacterium]
MRYSQLLAAGLATAVGLISLSGLSAQSPAQKTAPAAQAKPSGLQCTAAASPKAVPDPFKDSLVGDFPKGLLPIDDKVKDSILKSGLPCQEHVRPDVGVEKQGLENLQRAFDFYSWRTFIALNSPANGTPIEQTQPDMRTRWEDMDNFKQLLDVMLPANMQPPKWPTDRAEMEAERDRLMPEECRQLHKQMPDRMI